MKKGGCGVRMSGLSFLRDALIEVDLISASLILYG